MLRMAFLFALSALSASAAEQWTRLNTPHFELYTTAGDKKGRELILYFEQVRSFFTQVWPSQGNTEFPVRIVVFRNEKQYKPYAPNEVAAAYYAPGRHRDYIVLGDTDPEHLPAAIHEYMHLMVRHSGLKLPVWLNEGWADLYSTLKPAGRKTMVGDLIPGRVQALMTEKWMSFDALTSVGPKSATYNEKNRAGIFYAESWALAHMLYLAPEYSPKFAAFVAAVNRGKTAAEACRIAYGRTSAEVYADLQAYLRRNRLFGAVFEAKLAKSEEEAEASLPAAFESETMLADLLSVSGKREQAVEAFRNLASENPGNPEIPAAEAYLAWQNGDRDSARALFAKAFAAGGKDPEMCYHLGALELEKDPTSSLAIAALKRALDAKPDYTDARLRLGLAQLNAHDYAAGVGTLQQIHKIGDEQAPTLFNGLAYGYFQTGEPEKAREAARNALKWDQSDADKERTANIMAVLDSRAAFDAPPAPPKNPFSTPGERLERLEGTAKAMDCEGKRFVIETGGRTLAFDMQDPGRIQLRHRAQGTFEFTCGPLEPFRVTVEYAPSNQPGGNVAGVLKSLEF
jgi:tetratricopeptide (TPR) repeat protein